MATGDRRFNLLLTNRLSLAHLLISKQTRKFSSSKKPKHKMFLVYKITLDLLSAWTQSQLSSQSWCTRWWPFHPARRSSFPWGCPCSARTASSWSTLRPWAAARALRCPPRWRRSSCRRTWTWPRWWKRRWSPPGGWSRRRLRSGDDERPGEAGVKVRDATMRGYFTDYQNSRQI